MKWFICLVLFAFGASTANSQNIGKFVMISDFHYDPAVTVPQYGADSPLWLINKTVHDLADIVRDDPCDFIVTGGDLVSHSLSSMGPTQATALFVEVLDTLTNSFTEAFGTQNKFLSSPIMAIGNNDLYPKYAGPGTTPDWFVSFADHWPSINYQDTSRASFLQNGTYAIDVPIPGGKTLRVLSLHTNYWSVWNTRVQQQDQDPAAIFLFLSEQLATAKQQGVFVYILGHIPPGIDQYDQSQMWQTRFVPIYTNIVTPYLGTTVMGQLFGHEHVSLIHMFGDKASSAGPVQYHSSISPYYDNLPSFRIYTYNRDTLQLLDYEDWFMDFQAPDPQYQKLFSSALQEYNIPSLDTNGYCEFIANMYNNDSLLSTYIYNSILPSPNRAGCDDTCHQSVLCQMQFLNMDDYQSCMNPQKNLRLQCLNEPTNMPTTPPQSSTTGKPDHKPLPHSKMVSIVVGGIFGVLLFGVIIGVIVYFRIIRARRHSHTLLNDGTQSF